MQTLYTFQVSLLVLRRKDPGAEDPTLVRPLEGGLYDLADLNLLLEKWSNGVLECWKIGYKAINNYLIYSF